MIGLHQLPLNENGIISGKWILVLSSPMNHHAGPAHFQNGVSNLVEGHALRGLVANFCSSLMLLYCPESGAVLSHDDLPPSDIVADLYGADVPELLLPLVAPSEPVVEAEEEPKAQPAKVAKGKKR